jgi:ligand-binding sensor domain-containing protein
MTKKGSFPRFLHYIRLSTFFPMRCLTFAKYLLGGIYLISHSYFLGAQPFIRLRCRHITTNSGLSDAYVRKVVRDPYGYIWVGTDDGLNRFDGKNFAIYNKGLAATHTLSGADIWDLALDTALNRIWSINSFGGIDAVDYRTGSMVYHYFQMQHKATSDLRFTCLALAGDRLYIGSTSGLWMLQTDSLELRKVTLIDPLDRPGSTVNIDHLVSDATGHLWLFCRGGAVILLDRKQSAVSSFLGGENLGAPGHSSLQFYDCDPGRDGRIIAGTNVGLKAFSLDAAGQIVVSNDPFPGIPHTQNCDIYSCRHDAMGNIWFCTANCFAMVDSASHTLYYIKENTGGDDLKWLDAAFDIYFDQDNNLWLGCQQGLLFAPTQPACFTTFSKSTTSGIRIRHAYFLHPVNDSIIYCAAQDGLYHVNSRSGVIDCLEARPYYHVMLDPFNRLIASNPDGTFVFHGRHKVHIATVYPEFRLFPKFITNSHCYLGDSIVLFGTHNERGVVAWNFKRRKAMLIDKSSPGLSLKENTVTNVYRDTRGLIWVLGYNSVTLLDWSSRKIHWLDTHNPFLNKAYSIFFDVAENNGMYYLASYGAGVLVLDSQYHFMREISVNDGLTSNSIYRILPFRDSLLFVTSNNGLSVIDVQHAFQVRQFYAGDGLHSDNFEEYSGSALDGILYAGGSNGFTRIDPSLLESQQAAPRLMLRRIEVQTTSGSIDTSNILLISMKIPNNALQTTLSFSAFSYGNPERPDFSYRIKELKGDWINIGKRDFINFIGQNPGTYTLQVRAANEKGIWGKSALEMKLIFLPKWYQTLWFRIIILLASGVFFYTLYWYRLRQIRKQQQIRSGIASDLHDDIGSLLNSVKVFSHLARREPSQSEHFHHIDESLQQASIGLRDMIWVLDNPEDTVSEVMDRIRKFAIPITSASGIRLDFTFSPAEKTIILTKTEKRNFLMIAKEAINNSIKYSHCHMIIIYCHEAKTGIILRIEDDGEGFDSSLLTLGNGIRNMTERARQIRYFCRVDSAPGAGTRILISKKKPEVPRTQP